MFRKTFKKGLSSGALAKSGFSLVELLVVITIIAILSVAAYSAVGGNTIKARDAKRKQDITTIQQALELYFAENGSYPTPSSTYSLTAGTAAGQVSKKYLSEIPKDPGTKKRDYQYFISGATYEIATTLEVDGAVNHYESYVVGNSDNGIAKTKNGLGKKLNTDGTALESCINDTSLKSETITNSKCVPYDPNKD
jgi:prepilin-type N-terminal cleavage/methylation domain-containing protein